MDDISITKISSKGQIVIPSEMRKGIHEGEKLVIIRSGDQIILKPVKDFGKNIEEDIEFAKRTEDAWKRYEKGQFKQMESEDFLKMLKKL